MYPYETLGSANNLPDTLNSTYTYTNTAGYSYIQVQITVPTGAGVTFLGSVDGTNFTPLSLCGLSTNQRLSTDYATSCDIDGLFQGSIAGLASIQFKVNVDGSAPGTVQGRVSRDQIPPPPITGDYTPGYDVLVGTAPATPISVPADNRYKLLAFTYINSSTNNQDFALTLGDNLIIELHVPAGGSVSRSYGITAAPIGILGSSVTALQSATGDSTISVEGYLLHS